MNPFLTSLRETVVPVPGGRHGPLPPLLLGLTVVTGLVDAFSYLVLGHVFVANMTGNVVFLGFSVVGAKGFSFAASCTALGGFALGAVLGGRIGSRDWNRAVLLSVGTSIQLGLLAVAIVVAAEASSPMAASSRYSLIAILGLAMGVQNAVARKLAVPDLTTTVLTMTITGMTADSSLAGGGGSKVGRRLVAILSMLLGALVGAVLVLHGMLVWPLGIAAFVLFVIALLSRRVAQGEEDWLRLPN
jgi:uncharacterized membrane protein YoaK (UPF0700 family)